MEEPTTHALAQASVKMNYLSEEQKTLLRKTICFGASDVELQLFFQICDKTGLDPFTRQIYLIERKSRHPTTKDWVTKKEPLVSIDGLRITAERSGLYAGQDGPYWCGPDGKWLDVWLSDTHPMAAKVGVMKRGFNAPLYAVASYSEYVQRTREGAPTKFWAEKPSLMLAKVAEALALRKAFPNDMSGLYVREEMPDDISIPATPQLEPQALENKSTEHPTDLSQLKSYTMPEFFTEELAGRPITDFPPQKILSYVEQINDAARKKNKPITNPSLIEFFEKADLYASLTASHESHPRI